MKRCLSGLMALGGLIGGSCAGSSHSRDPWESWTTLQLEAEAGPLFRGEVEMRFEDGQDGRRLVTRSTAKFLGITLGGARTETVFDRATGRTKSYHSYTSKRGRRYRFGDGAYTVEKLRPPEGAEVSPDEWDVTSREEFPYPVGAEASGPPYDYYGMLLHLRELELNEPGDASAVYVATSKGPLLFRVLVAESRVKDHEYTDLATGQKKTEELRQLRLRLVPGDPEADEGFLDMEGETEVWVEAVSKTPIEILGKIPKVPGRVTIRLSARG